MGSPYSWIKSKLGIEERDNTMKLEKTVDMMVSEDWKERLKAEYHQVLYRRNKLQQFVKEVKAGSVKPAYPVELLIWQLKTMDNYIYILKMRAEAEKIDLKG